ncbi:MAG: pyruvate flavodoxin/ferredoxin oxidoreductase [candidate division WOR-3 bacterium]
MKTFISGGEAIGFSAIKGGIRFYAGYPITPASGIYAYMIENLPKVGGFAVGASDEISAISYCIGASMRGLKSMTATSAPGFSLMIESIGYALMTETPVLIVLCQRMGPSTGAATSSSQGDLLFSIFSNSGGYSIPVFSPSSIKDAFYTTVHSINVSEILRTPVILLTEKEITMTYETIDKEEIKFPEIHERKYFDGENFKTYYFKELHDVPPFSPVGGKYRIMATGSAHDKEGFLKKDDPEVIEVLKHLNEKIVKNIEKFNIYEYYEGKENLVITYGVTSKSVIDAYKKLKNEVGVLIMKLLYPVPSIFMKETLKKYKKIFVVEENLTGQYADVLKMSGILENKEVIKINKIGDLISPSEIIEVIKKNG